MNAAFFHDHKFRRDASGNHLSTGGLSYAVLARYLQHFTAVTVVAREIPMSRLEHAGDLTVATGPGIEFRCVNLRTPLDAFWARSIRGTVRSVVAAADCVIARLPSALGYIACHEATRAGTPWAVEVVGCPRDALWNYGNTIGKLATLPYMWLQRHYVKRAAYALYVSRRFLQRRYACNAVTEGCPDAAIPDCGDEVLARRVARIDRGWADRPVYFGLVGSLDVGFKGHDTAIKALASIKDTLPDFRLRILGAGRPDRWRALALEYGIHDKLVFDGTLPGGAAVFEWMDNLDVFLMPSLQETLGRALLEAMSRGCPALGSRETALPEQLGDDCIHGAADCHELGGLIAHMLGNREYMRLCAFENFYRARKYSSALVDSRRRKFWDRFVNHVNQRHLESATDRAGYAERPLQRNAI